MKTFFIVIFVLIFLMFLYLFLTRKYVNPYTLTMVFGKKGCGKTTFLTKLAYQHKKKGWIVFSTEDIANTYKIDYTDIGKYWLKR